MNHALGLVVFQATDSHAAGLFTGVWHGALSVLRLAAKLFTEVDVWSDQSSGVGYAVGFLGGAIIGVPISLFVLLAIVTVTLDRVLPKKYVLVSSRTYQTSIEPDPKPPSATSADAGTLE